MEYIKIALSELRSVLQCFYHAALQVWFKNIGNNTDVVSVVANGRFSAL